MAAQMLRLASTSKGLARLLLHGNNTNIAACISGLLVLDASPRRELVWQVSQAPRAAVAVTSGAAVWGRHFASLPVAAEAALLDEPHEPEPPPQQRSRRQLQPHGMVERESMPLSPVHSVGLLSAQAYRNQYQMTVDVRDAPDPCQTFEHADLPPALLGALRKHGFTAPTFIQAQAWPIARQGRDLVAIASTGSGKTAGFLVPAFLHIQQQQAEQLQASEDAAPAASSAASRGPAVRAGAGSWAGRWSRPGTWGGGSLPHALVLAPTRELAQQIQNEAERLGAPLRLRNACLYGGAPRGPQGKALARGPAVVIATPGRLLDFVNSGELDVSRVSMLVLDEADRMLDMGFEPQIRELLSFMPGGANARERGPGMPPLPPRQTLFFSATWPREVQSIARTLCRNDPVRVFVGAVSDKLVANRDVKQMVLMLGDEQDKLPALLDYVHEHLQGAESISSSSSNRQQERSSAGSVSMLRGSRRAAASAHGASVLDSDEEAAAAVARRVVVFAATKRDVDDYSRELSRAGVRAVAVHGNKTQYERDTALRAFRSGKVPVLVATDVAARGLDIPGVTAVVNMSFPIDHDMYVHRIGRTGRAGRTGEALTMLTPQDSNITPVLVQIMRDAQQEVPEELAAVAARVARPAHTKHRYGGGGGGGRRGGGGWSGGGRGGGGRRGGGGGGGGGWGSSSSSYGSGGGGGRSSARGDVDSWSSGSGGGGGRRDDYRGEGGWRTARSSSVDSW